MIGRKWLAVVLAASSLPFAATAAEPTPPPIEPPADKLSEMFTWWNQAMKTPGAFTEQAFAKYFTADAALVIDGKDVMRTPAGWAQRFQAIHAATDAVEIVVPFRYSFQKDDQIYTYHIIRSRAAGKVECMLAAGHADLKDGKISHVTLVRASIDPASDPDCWRE